MKKKYFAAFSAHVIHLIFFILVTWRMYHHLELLGNETPAFTAAITFTVIGVFLQIFSCYCTIRLKTDVRKWLPNLLFILSTIVQYGITLHYSHLSVDGSPQGTNGVINSGDRTACRTLESLGEKNTYYVLLLTLPSLIITNMLYYQTGDENNRKAAFRIAFSALDIIDMAELIFADIGCYQTFGAGWLTMFYIACGVSAILTAFTAYGLEQQNGSDDGRDGKNWFATFFNMVFNDGMFLFLRIVTMSKTGHAYFGLIFAIKEGLSLFLRGALLFC